jgi:hypothetical protein
MKTPREILLAQHQAASSKLDAIRAEVVADISPKTISWREMALSLRSHLAALSAAWMVVVLLNSDHSRGGLAMTSRAATAEPRQIWASLRERRRLLLQYTDAPVVETPPVPGRRSEIEAEQIEV